MMRFLVVVLGLALPLSAPGAALAQAAADTPATLTVTGEGRVAATPDQAVLRVGVEALDKEAARAMDAASDTMDALLAALADENVAPRDMQTSALSLDLMYRGDSGSLKRGDDEYRARNTLAVTLRDIDRVGAVLQALLQAGANDFSGLSFGLQDPRPSEDAARRAAVADARARAELYAEAAGVTLGPILSISEGGVSGPMPLDAPMMLESRAKVPVAAGETMLQATVTVVWSLETE